MLETPASDLIWKLLVWRVLHPQPPRGETLLSPIIYVNDRYKNLLVKNQHRYRTVTPNGRVERKERHCAHVTPYPRVMLYGLTPYEKALNL